MIGAAEIAACLHVWRQHEYGRSKQVRGSLGFHEKLEDGI